MDFSKGADAHLSAGQVTQIQILDSTLVVVPSQRSRNEALSQDRTSLSWWK